MNVAIKSWIQYQAVHQQNLQRSSLQLCNILILQFRPEFSNRKYSDIMLQIESSQDEIQGWSESLGLRAQLWPFLEKIKTFNHSEGSKGMNLRT